MTHAEPVIRRLGRVDYERAWADMRTFTDGRDPGAADELWLVEHAPVFTLGRAARWEHLVEPGDIPVVHVDRGGQVTYHGPGQVVLYTLVDLPRRGMGIRQLVTTLEEVVVALLATHGVHADTRKGAPGVYVDGRKIAALGLRVRRGCSYHGLALNVDCDLDAFGRIDPCGYRGLPVTRTRDEGIAASPVELGDDLAKRVAVALGQTTARPPSPATETP